MATATGSIGPEQTRPEGKSRRPLAVSMGDPAGIGPEITLRAWADRSECGLAPFAVFGDAETFTERARHLGLNVPVQAIASLQEAASVFAKALPVVHRPLPVRVRPGVPDGANAAAIIGAISAATDAVLRGEATAVVTNPIAKHVVKSADFPFPGHTEFLAALAERYKGRHFRPVMMLASKQLRVVPLTVHCALAEVPKMITRPLIFETVRITYNALKRDFGIATPRIAIAGLNPHAGEEGTMGREEIDIIGPAIADLRAEGLLVTGPHSADTLFHAAARRSYDAVIAMYHDQALIPLKTIGFDEGVNVTLGLPFVRTSPDHGTAFDIAAAGRASATSLIEAMRMASTIAAERAATTPQ
ncbi:4-hydroxythreonine-4-phosphate dehydrogenase PdxA [Hyphomicrobium sulfonivorans]|nr:4-hydroxythreonine-4-phosphate dehydrogenase PdxA [Hyphomicrobium sulfonivorans]